MIINFLIIIQANMKQKKKNTASGAIAVFFLFSLGVALLLAVDVFGNNGLQLMDASFRVYAVTLVGAAFFIQLIAFIYLKTHNDSIDELQRRPIRERKVIAIIMMVGMALPLLLLFQLQNSLALCMSVQYWLVLPSDVPSLWSLQLPMLGYTSAFSVFWMLVLGLLGMFWIRHLKKKTLAYQHILISIVSMILLYWLASWATQYLWWNIYGVYNEVSGVSYSTQIASMLLALLVLVVLGVLFAAKKDSSSNAKNCAPDE